MQNSNLTMSMVVILLVCSAVAQNSCTNTNTNEYLLQTGLIQFSVAEPNTNSTGQYSKQIQILYTVPLTGLSYVLSLNSYNDFNPTVQGSDWQLIGIPLNQTLNARLLIAGTKWTTLTVAYLIESRPDLFVGSINFNLVSSFNASSLSQSILLPNWTPTIGTHVETVYLSGLQTSTSLVTLSSAIVFNPITGNITVTLSSSTQNITFSLIKVSYIVGLLYSTLPAGIAPILFQKAATGNFFNATDGLLNSVPQLDQFGFKLDSFLCMGSQCQGNCITQLMCTQLKGIILGNNCYICDYENQQWSVADNKCKCVANAYSLTNAACILCSGLSILANNSCLCPPNFQGQLTGLLYTCIKQCQLLSHLDTSTQNCLCNIPQMVMSITGICACPPTMIQINNACTCNSTSFLLGTTCVTCPADMFAKDGFCSCIDTLAVYHPENQTCIRKKECGVDAVSIGDTCICRVQGAILDRDGNCFCSLFFTPSLEVQSRCICDRSIAYTNSDGVCVQYPICSNTLVLNYADCKCTCPNPDQRYNGFGCMCPANQIATADNKACVCMQNTVFYQGKCVRCGPNSYFSNAKCLCFSGYYMTETGLCVMQPQCVPGAAFDLESKGCACKQKSQIMALQRCVCPAGSYPNNVGQCVCGGSFCGCIAGSYTYKKGVGCVPFNALTQSSIISLHLLGCSLMQTTLYCVLSMPTNMVNVPSLLANIAGPLFFHPKIQITTVASHQGCYVISFTDPKIIVTPFSFNILFRVGCKQIQGPIFSLEPQKFVIKPFATLNNVVDQGIFFNNDPSQIAFQNIYNSANS